MQHDRIRLGNTVPFHLLEAEHQVVPPRGMRSWTRTFHAAAGMGVCSSFFSSEKRGGAIHLAEAMGSPYFQIDTTNLSHGSRDCFSST